MRKISISYFLPLLILSQSCVIYQKQPVSIYQALDKGKVKLISESGIKFEFDNIRLEDNLYYGIGRQYISEVDYIKGDSLKTRLDSIMVSSVFLKNRQKSISRTTLLIVVSTMGAFVLGVVIYEALYIVE